MLPRQCRRPDKGTETPAPRFPRRGPLHLSQRVRRSGILEAIREEASKVAGNEREWGLPNPFCAASPFVQEPGTLVLLAFGLLALLPRRRRR